MVYRYIHTNLYFTNHLMSNLQIFHLKNTAEDERSFNKLIILLKFITKNNLGFTVTIIHICTAHVHILGQSLLMFFLNTTSFGIYSKIKQIN